MSKYIKVYGSKKPAVIDDQDFELVSQFDWYLQGEADLWKSQREAAGQVAPTHLIADRIPLADSTRRQIISMLPQKFT
jgi:hypothetical protein